MLYLEKACLQMYTSDNPLPPLIDDVFMNSPNFVKVPSPFCFGLLISFLSFLQTVRNDPSGQAMLIAHNRVDGHPHINPLQEVIVGDKLSYLFFPPCSTDLHSYVRTRRRLREPHARILFRQIVSAVHEAHSKGLVLRDLKLRKFVFTDDSW